MPPLCKSRLSPDQFVACVASSPSDQMYVTDPAKRLVEHGIAQHEILMCDVAGLGTPLGKSPSLAREE